MANTGTFERPRLDIARASLDTALEVGGIVVLVALWGYTVATYSSLPDTIPSHFDFAGHVDGTSSRGLVWLLPCLASILYTLLAIITRYPHSFNYLRPITEENALRQYTLATRMMRALKLGVVALMLLIQIMIVLTAQGAIAGPSFWVIVAALLLVLFPVGWYTVRALRES